VTYRDLKGTALRGRTSSFNF